VNLPDIFLNWQSAAVALVIYAVTESVRRAIQAAWKSWRSSPFYTEFVLFVLPIAIGVAIAFAVPSFAWPEPLVTTSSRAMYTAVLGLFATAIYGWAKKVATRFFSNDPKNKA